MADAKFRKEVEKTFATLKEQVRRAQPGVLEALQVVEQVDPWLIQLDAYLTALNPEPHFTSASATPLPDH